MLNLVIWGATGQAIVLEELLMGTNVEIKAFFDNDSKCISPVKNIPIYIGEIGFKLWLSTIDKGASYHYLVAIGGNTGETRSKIGKMFEDAGLKPYSAIHQTAFIAKNALIGECAQILAQSSICARVTIGKNCIINTGASIDHECILGNNVHIGPGAKLAGSIIIEDNVFVGINATILPRIKIGKNAIIGAGAVVTKDVLADRTVVGNPARLINNL